MTVVQDQIRHKKKNRRWPSYPLVPEERLDVEHVAHHKMECLGCGHVNNIGRRFCEVCGRIVVA